MTPQSSPEVGGAQNINNHTYFSGIDMTLCHFLGKHGHGIAEHVAVSSLVHLRSVADSFPTIVIPSHKLRLPSYLFIFSSMQDMFGGCGAGLLGDGKWGWDSNRMRFRREGPHHLLVKQPVWQPSRVCCNSRLMFPVSNGAYHDNSGSSMIHMELSALFIQLGHG